MKHHFLDISRCAFDTKVFFWKKVRFKTLQNTRYVNLMSWSNCLQGHIVFKTDVSDFFKTGLTITMITKSRSSRRRCSIKKVFLKFFPKFTRKHLLWSLFLTKLSKLTIKTSEYIFYRTTSVDCFWKSKRNKILQEKSKNCSM